MGKFLDQCENDAWEVIWGRKKIVLRETSNGKKMPCYATFPPKPKYSELGLQNKTRLAKDIVNEYRRLQALLKRLNDKGYYGRW